MPDQPGRTSSRDFQSFAHQLGGADVATSTPYPQHIHDRYDAARPSNAQSAPPSQSQEPMQDAIIRYSDFGASHSSLPPQAPHAQFPGYSFGPDGPLVWDWNNSLAFPDFTNHYEPQGELVREPQNQSGRASDFMIPLPVVNTDNVYQSPQAVQNVALNPSSTSAQNPLSPPLQPPQRPPSLQTGLKRKAEPEPNSAVSNPTRFSTEIQQNPAKRMNKSRSSSSASNTPPVIATTADAQRASMTQSTSSLVVSESAPATIPSAIEEGPRQKESSKGAEPQGRVTDASKSRKIVESSARHNTLPAGKVFPIQIGSELFRLSGASISSDAPSYFSHFFSEQLHSNSGRAGDLKTLYIDRDPDTFRDIALHLQGYHILPKDGEHFVRLFADAQFYSLPRLTKALFSTDIFIRIGGTPFQIPRDLFSSPGDSPNYFSLGFAQFFTTPTEVFPGLDRSTLLRPPSILPPAVPSRNGETFAEIVKLLQGYSIDIRNEAHRTHLLRDVRYFHLRGLEQKLISCDIAFNRKRNQSEILIRLEDIRQSGISVKPDIPSSISTIGPGISPDSASTSHAPSMSGNNTRAGHVLYARPYTDDHASVNILILEVSSTESTTLYFPAFAPTPIEDRPLSLDLRATFHSNTLARMKSLFSVIVSRMGLPATHGVSERKVQVRIATDCYIEMDNVPVELGIDDESGRLGMKKINTERHTKPMRVSEDRYEYDGHRETSRSEWIWGGAKEDQPRTCQTEGSGEEEESGEEWVVKRAHWRLQVEPQDGEGGKLQVVLCGVRIEGFTIERSRNRERGFLGA